MTAGGTDADRTAGAGGPETGERPLDLLEVLDLAEVEPAAGARHTEILTRTGKLGVLWDGEPGDGRVVVACGGAFGGLIGPRGLYFDLARALVPAGVTFLRVDYRRPGDLGSCVLDLAVAVDLAERSGGTRFVVVGHSFGGAVVIRAAAALPDLVVGVVTLAGQSAGCEPVSELGKRPFLLLHGSADEIIPVRASATVRDFAGHGELVVLPGVGHQLAEAGEELRARLPPWILAAFEGRTLPF
jgi:uncharacterized protein